MTPSGLEPAVRGRSLHPGRAQGIVLRLDEPLSFWGGVDPRGRIVEARHPQFGESLTDRLVAMPTGRGSSSSTAVLAELIRAGASPAAILLVECDTIVVTGVLVAAEIYGRSIPVVQVSAADLTRLESGQVVVVDAGSAGGGARVAVHHDDVAGTGVVE